MMKAPIIECFPDRTIVSSKDGKGGIKHDCGKERFDLIPPTPLFLLAQVYTYGIGKYDDRNWEEGLDYSRVFAAIMRHLWKWWGGEENDKESNLSHLAHAAWGCFALLEYCYRETGTDNRPYPKKEKE